MMDSSLCQFGRIDKLGHASNYEVLGQMSLISSVCNRNCMQLHESMGPLTEFTGFCVYKLLPCTGPLINFAGLDNMWLVILQRSAMVKNQAIKCQPKDKGKKKMAQNNVGISKRGRRLKKEIMENLFEVYAAGNSLQIRNVIHGWERESDSKEEDIEVQEENMDFVFVPGSTRGWLSLFHQSIHTYWALKCVLAKALQSFQISEGNP